MRAFRLALLAVSSACAAPTTFESRLAPGVEADEVRLQQQLAIQAMLRGNARVQRLAWDFQRVSAPRCPRPTTPGIGLMLLARDAFEPEMRPAAASLGIGDTVTVVYVVPGSPAEAAGFREGDRLLSVGGAPVQTRARGVLEVASVLHLPPGPLTTVVRVRRGPPFPDVSPEEPPLRLDATGAVVAEASRPAVPPPPPPPDTVTLALRDPPAICPIPAVAVTDPDPNAFTDGERVWVTSGMLRFAADADLRTVLAHEYAHALERHGNKQQGNLTTGFLLGALLDVFGATQGADLDWTFATSFAERAVMRYSREFEHEADYVGLYLLALAGYDPSGAAGFWRRLAIEAPESITYASTHPTTAARFARMRQAAAEIARKRVAGQPLEPERKDGTAGRADAPTAVPPP